jgi:hypothetical protein
MIIVSMSRKDQEGSAEGKGEDKGDYAVFHGGRLLFLWGEYIKHGRAEVRAGGVYFLLIGALLPAGLILAETLGIKERADGRKNEHSKHSLCNTNKRRSQRIDRSNLCYKISSSTVKKVRTFSA